MIIFLFRRMSGANNHLPVCKFLVQLNIFLEAFKERNFWFRQTNFLGHSGREISNLDMRQSRMEIYGADK